LTTRTALQKALISSSVDIAELEAQARLARTRAEVAGEATRPRLDLDGYVESQGVSERVPKAAERAGGLGWITAHVGATFELPLDDSRRQAEKQSALLAVRMADYNLRALRDRLSAEAAATLADERAAEQRLLLAERTVAVSEEAYAAARGRFELGGAIALQVQQAEEDVRRARQRLARARVDLTQAQVSIEHLMGALAARYLPNKLRTK
jgi:outer membrane protein TolC